MKKNYFQDIAKKLNKNTQNTENAGPNFALLKITEYWVRFLQADPDYLNVEPLVTLMNFEAKTELVYALAKIEEENLRRPAAVASRVNYCGPHGRSFHPRRIFRQRVEKFQGHHHSALHEIRLG